MCKLIKKMLNQLKNVKPKPREFYVTHFFLMDSPNFFPLLQIYLFLSFATNISISLALLFHDHFR